MTSNSPLEGKGRSEDLESTLVGSRAEIFSAEKSRTTKQVMSKREASTKLKEGWDEDESFRESKKRSKTNKGPTKSSSNTPKKIKAADANPYVFTRTDDGALETAIKEYGRAWSTIQKEYFPQLKAKQIQNHVMNTQALKVQ